MKKYNTGFPDFDPLCQGQGLILTRVPKWIKKYKMRLGINNKTEKNFDEILADFEHNKSLGIGVRLNWQLSLQMNKKY